MPGFAGYQQVGGHSTLTDNNVDDDDDDESAIEMDDGCDGQQIFVNLRLGKDAEVVPRDGFEVQPIRGCKLRSQGPLRTTCDQALSGSQHSRFARNFLTLMRQRWRRWCDGGQYRRRGTAILRKAEKVLHVDTGDPRHWTNSGLISWWISLV